MDRILAFDLPMLTGLALQLLNTLILCGALSWLLYKPVLKFMKNRTDRISNQITSAEQNLEQSEKLKETYEQKLKEIDKERLAILEDARKRAIEKETQIINDAKAEAETIRNRAALEIEREQQKVKDQIKTQMVEISALMASNYIKTNLDTKTGNKLIDQAISELEGVKWLS